MPANQAHRKLHLLVGLWNSLSATIRVDTIGSALKWGWGCARSSRQCPYVPRGDKGVSTTKRNHGIFAVEHGLRGWHGQKSKNAESQDLRASSTSDPAREGRYSGSPTGGH